VPGVRVKREKSILPVNGIVRRTGNALVEERTRCADEPSMYECTNHLSESASLESGGDAYTRHSTTRFLSLDSQSYGSGSLSNLIDSI
jgi:hypothetical protein